MVSCYWGEPFKYSLIQNRTWEVPFHLLIFLWPCSSFKFFMQLYACIKANNDRKTVENDNLSAISLILYWLVHCRFWRNPYLNLRFEPFLWTKFMNFYFVFKLSKEKFCHGDGRRGHPVRNYGMVWDTDFYGSSAISLEKILLHLKFIGRMLVIPGKAQRCKRSHYKQSVSVLTPRGFISSK